MTLVSGIVIGVLIGVIATLAGLWWDATDYEGWED